MVFTGDQNKSRRNNSLAGNCQTLVVFCARFVRANAGNRACPLSGYHRKAHLIPANLLYDFTLPLQHNLLTMGANKNQVFLTSTPSFQARRGEQRGRFIPLLNRLSLGSHAPFGLKSAAIFALVLLAVVTARAQTGPMVVKSPNGALEISIATLRGQTPQDSGGQLAYRVTFRGRVLLDWSNLGLAFDGSPALGPTARMESSQASTQDKTWTAVHGKEKSIRNHYNAGAVRTVETAANGRRLGIEVRACDDGVVFRYVLPEQPNLKEARIQKEYTQFNFTQDAVIWPLILRGFQTSSEGDYPEMPMANLRPDNLVYLPFLLHLPGVAWVGLAEADIDDYASLFVTTAGSRSLVARLSPRVEDVNTSADTTPALDPKKDASAVSVIAQPVVKSASVVVVVKTTSTWFFKPYTRFAAASDLLHPGESNATWFQKPKSDKLEVSTHKQLATVSKIAICICRQFADIWRHQT